MPTPALRRMHDTREMVARPDEDVRGREVLDSAGEHIGTVDDLMIDEAHEKVRFLRVACGGFLGLRQVPAHGYPGFMRQWGTEH